MRRIKLFWFGDSACSTTGFGVVAKNILERLHKTGKYDIVQFGLNYWGDPHDEPFKIYPVRKNPYGQDRLYELLINEKPDILISNNDLFSTSHWIPNVVAKVRKDGGLFLPWIHYFPVDGIPLINGWLNSIENIDYPITYTKWASDNINKQKSILNIKYIYHGADINVFHPLSFNDKRKLKRQLGGEDKFVIGFVGRNQPRKKIPLLMEAFKRFSEDKKDKVVLYMHTCAIDKGWDINLIANNMGLSDRRCVLSNISNPAKGFDLVSMNEIYNVMDIMFLPTVGEGFGLPIAESMSAGTPVAATNCSAIPEIIGDTGYPIQVDYVDWLVDDYGYERQIPSIGHMAMIMQRVYDNREELKLKSIKSRERIIELFNWDKIAVQWNDIINSALPLSNKEELIELEEVQ